MFRNLPELDKKEDQRVRRTRDRLGDAMMALLVEKPFDDITVQDVLDRAEVSRSTFYAHFRDKTELVAEACTAAFEAAVPNLERIAAGLRQPNHRVERGLVRRIPIQRRAVHVERLGCATAVFEQLA